MTRSSKHTGALEEKEGVTLPDSLSKEAAEKLKHSRKKTPSVKQLIDGIVSGDKTALSRAITIIESKASKHQQQAREIIESCLPKANKSVRIGITGVPGVGKSTFIESFGNYWLPKTIRSPSWL